LSHEIPVENTTNSGGTVSVSGLLTGITPKELTEDNIENVFNGILRHLVDYFGATAGYIIIKDKDKQLKTIAAISANQQDSSLTTTSQALIDKVIQTANSIIVPDAANSQQFPGDPGFQRFNIKAALCAAIKAFETVLGVIYLDTTESNCKWDQSRLDLLEFTGIHIGLAVNCMHLSDQAKENERLATTGKAMLMLSHSVKNILQIAGGAAEVVDFGLRTNQIHRVKRSWGILKPNLERIRKFTLDMLDYSRERTLELKPCDFNRVIQSAIESLNAQLKQKKSQLNIRIDQKIPPIELDSERIHEMALNLILNAIDIVDETTGVVSVETKYLPNEQHVQLAVTDNGSGMSEEMKEKIFTPFESGKNKFGTGLGMPIAKQIIDQHNATIDIDSRKGEGTTFTVTLPAKIVAENA